MFAYEFMTLNKLKVKVYFNIDIEMQYQNYKTWRAAKENKTLHITKEFKVTVIFLSVRLSVNTMGFKFSP